MTALLPAYTGRNHIYHTDALSLMRSLGDKSVDAYITDLPYQVTQMAWDVVIPFEPMWTEVKRTLKQGGVFVTTASQPFTTRLISSNYGMFKYEWIWDKVSPVGFLNVNNRPMMQHESILVFADGAGRYIPQLRRTVTKPFGDVSAKRKASGYGESGDKINYGVGYPLSILKFKRPNNLSGGGLHPNQKPLELYEYLISTYTQPGDLVVDFCCGSGTTCLAARNLGRDYIGSDITREYVDISLARLAQAWTPLLFSELAG